MDRYILVHRDADQRYCNRLGAKGSSTVKSHWFSPCRSAKLVQVIQRLTNGSKINQVKSFFYRLKWSVMSFCLWLLNHDSTCMKRTALICLSAKKCTCWETPINGAITFSLWQQLWNQGKGTSRQRVKKDMDRTMKKDTSNTLNVPVSVLFLRASAMSPYMNNHQLAQFSALKIDV